MFCKWCRSENVANCRFVTGCDHFRLTTVKDQEGSKSHKYNVSKCSVSQSDANMAGDNNTGLSPSGRSEASKCLQQLKKAEKLKV